MSHFRNTSNIHLSKIINADYLFADLVKKLIISIQAIMIAQPVNVIRKKIQIRKSSILVAPTAMPQVISAMKDKQINKAPIKPIVFCILAPTDFKPEFPISIRNRDMTPAPSQSAHMIKCSLVFCQAWGTVTTAPCPLSSRRFAPNKLAPGPFAVL